MRKMRNEDGELCSHLVNGYLIVTPVTELPESFFNSKSIATLMKIFCFDLNPFKYVNPGQQQVACLFSSATYKGESIAVEGYESLKSMSLRDEGFFTIYLNVENEDSFDPSYVQATIGIELAERDKLTLSPLVIQG